MSLLLLRLAFRNIARRRGEALLVVLGSLLGTAIICASFIVGDTLDESIRDLARTQLGPIDETLSVAGLDQLPALERAVGEGPAGTDGALTMVSTPATAASTGADRRAEPRAVVHEVDFAAAAAFGGDPAATGFADAPDEPRAGEVVLGEDLAGTLGAGVGDRVDVFAYGARLDLEVAGVLPRLGVAGFYPEPGSRSPVAFVAPGTIGGLATGAQGARPPTGRVFVSNVGGVYDGAAATAAVTDELRRDVSGLTGVDVAATKADVLEDAARQGDAFTELFTSIGGFSVIAGMLLLVNIFVMLAEERKPELGMLRAVGLKRKHLVRSFGIEGAVYAVAAAVIGALVGVGVGRVIVLVTAGLFSSDDFELALRFSVTPESLVTGGLVGLAISLLTVWATSIRIGRLNVIRAIRDQPEPAFRRQRLRTLVLAAAGLVAGALLFASGVSSNEGIPAFAGPALALASSVPLLARLVPRRLAVSVPCLLTLAWGVTAFSLLPDVFANSDIPVFVLQGVVLVASAVALGAANADLSSVLADRLSLSARLGLAYPVAKRFRTALLLGMYAIVVFTLTFLAVLARILEAQAPTLTEETRAGYDLLVDSSPGNPVTVEQLEAQDGVDAVAPLRRAFPEFAAPSTGADTETWAMSGFDDALLARGEPVLSERSPAFATDAEAWQAVLDDPSLAVVSNFFLAEQAGPPQDLFDPGDTFSVINTSTGVAHGLTVAGVVSSDFQFNGVLVGDDLVRELLGPLASPSRHYVAVEPGADPDAVAERLTGDLLANGVDAETFRHRIDTQLDQQNGFFRLMEGFLGIGLVIGIAGLGVVMVRAVRERRRQIGMLRAMGFPSRVVRSAFLFEATFIAAQGIAIGLVLGLVTSYTLLVSSSTFGESDLDFTVPWAALAVVLVVPLLASLVAAAVPATRAAAIRPAVALRIAD